MALRKSIPIAELREKRAGQDDKHATDYQASRGGWFQSTKPEPKKQQQPPATLNPGPAAPPVAAGPP